MKIWSFTLLLTLTVMAQPVISKPVDTIAAQNIALKFFKANYHIGHLPLSARLSYTRTETDGTIYFYVFDLTPAHAFVIVAADDNIIPILGYSRESYFNPDNSSRTGLIEWMSHASENIALSVKAGIPADTRIKNLWSSYTNGINPASSRSASVTPLLTTFWDQYPYYNDLCPYNSTDQLNCVTGCVATAMAQIMKYWNYPAKGTGSYSYNDGPPYFSYNYGTQSANFAATTYQWSKMPNSISGPDTAVATLMYDCGVAVAMDYGDLNQGGSGAYVLQSDAGNGNPCAQYAYVHYFSYDANTIAGAYESNYTDATWLSLIENELNAGRPLQYEGYDPSGGGHTWVCDGYDANNLVHMNWGWGGQNNGYYAINNLSAGGYTFSEYDAVLYGIQPTITAPAANFMANTTSSCSGMIQFTDLSTNFPSSWSWNFGDGSTSTLKNPEHTYTGNGIYTVSLTATNSNGSNTKTITNYITVSRPSAPPANNVSNCASSSFSLPVSTTNPVQWFDSTGKSVSSANPFVTPVLTKTTTYWVEDTTIANSYHVGPASNTIGSGGEMTANSRTMSFTVLKPSILQSVYIYSTGAGNRVIECMDTLGRIVNEATVYCPNGGGRVTLNFSLNTGSYSIGLADTLNVYRNSSGAVYPYTDAGGYVSITGNNGGSSANAYYYYFYDWIVQGLDCISQRQPVTATVGSLNAGISSYTNPTCNGMSNGKATVTNGSGSYTYLWSNNQTTATATGLGQGTYTVTVNNGTGCSVTLSQTITQPATITPVATATNVTCNGSNNGIINLSVTGGNSAYTYNWGGGITSQNRTGLSPATYTVTVTDGLGCTGTTSKTITQPAVLSSSSTATNVACNGASTGAVNVIVSGGTPNYTFNWGGGITGQNRTGLTAGAYSVTITDANTCTTTTSQTITQPAVISASAVTTNATCGGSTGTITLTVTGGTPNYSYNWGGGNLLQNLLGLAAGTYTVTITDAANCTATLSKTITQVNSLVPSANSTNVTCNGAATGSIDVSITGGTPNYTYNWGGGITSQNRSGLTAGTYAVTIADANNCTASISQTITQPTALAPSSTATNVACNGGNTGAITLTVTGGTPNYTFNWGSGIISQNRTSLIAGTYTVTITDANSCTASTSKTITQPTATSPGAAITNVACNGGNTGAITLTVTGGTPNYTFNWGNGITTQNRTGLTAGTYTATITDANACTSTTSQTVTQPTVISPTATITNVACSGGNTGSITLTVTGGTPNYTYTWGSGITTQNRTGLSAGTYTVTITDAAGCSTTLSKTITQSGTLTSSVTYANVSCNAGNNGSINLTVSGGTSNYSYNWGGGITSQNRTGLTAGSYSVTVTDGAGCSSIASQTITQPSAITSAATLTNVACNGGNTGAISLTVTGGTGNYTYNWGSGITSQNRTGLTAGSYTATITDANSCTTTTSNTITQATVIAPIATVTNVACNGGNTGTITLTVTGGTPNYTFNWGSGISSQNRTGLMAGTYTVTITDANACNSTLSKTITQPTAISPTATVTNVACSGSNTGAITLSVTGGTPNYTYNWGGGITTQNRTGLSAGNYTVIVTDAASCTASLSKTITQSGTLTSSVTSTNVSCNGGNNGTINLTVSGGTPNYSYNWGGSITSQNRSELSAGSYSVTVTDAAGCSSIASQTITQPTAITSTATVTNVACNGGNTGAIALTVTGGTPNYTFNWGSGITAQNRTSLAAGAYSVTITDANACGSTISKTITQPTGITSTATSTNVACNGGNTGAITLTVAGGTPNYTFNWGAGVTTQNLTGLTAGTYTATITDANACSSTTSKTITQPTAISPVATVTNVACSGGNTGAITLTVTGGTPNYTFNWGGGITSQNRTNLAAGTYTVTITDAASCTSSVSKTIAQGGTLTTSITSTNVTCNGGSNGTINLSVSGGNPNYTFNWGSGINLQNRTGLSAGTYSVTITDASGCNTSASQTIRQPAAISFTASTTNITCNGGNNGAINLTVAGGTPNYTYNWGSGISSQNRTGLTAGTYTATITDANTCTATASQTITQPAGITPVISGNNVLCNGGSTGTINVNASGGTPDYTFSWGNGITSQSRNALMAGTYTVTIIDANGCSITSSKTLTQPAVLNSTTAATNVACGGGNTGAIILTVTGGTPNFTYNWGGGIITQNRTSLTAGTYTVTVTDANGCTSVAQQGITQPTSISASATATSVECNGANNGSITLSVMGGTPNYTYNWGGGITTQNLTGLAAGSYTVTITDAAGCTATYSKTIAQNNSIVSSATATNVSCNGGNNGAISLSVSGGTPGYSYNWGSGITSQNRTGLGAGNYTATVTDAAGCVSIVTKAIIQPTAIQLTPTTANVACNGGNTGSINLAVTGGTPSYTYNWGNNITSQNRTGLAAGSYSATVTDAAGCQATISQAVNQATAITPVATITNVLCNGWNNGAVSLAVSGGTPNYTFNWSKNSTAQNITNLIAGIYTVTITDAAGCGKTMSNSVGQPAPLSAVAATTNVACNGNATGAIKLTVTGGIPNYIYNWGNNVTSANLTSLTSGSYAVTVTDGNGCKVTLSETITQPAALIPSASTTNLSCNGVNTGSVNLTVTGGTPNYTFNWGGTVTTQNRTNLAAGTYSVTITDANSCQATLTKTITQPTPVTITLSQTDASCNLANGSLSANVLGGTGGYSYSWDNNSTTDSISGLTSGKYSVVVTDGNGCTAVSATLISNRSNLMTNINVTNNACSGTSKGIATVNVTSGTQPYTYVWDNGSTSSSLQNLAAGNYIVTITDGYHCQRIDTVTLADPAPLSVSYLSTGNLCYGDNSGSVTIRVSGGTAGYMYSWSNGDTSEVLQQLPSGNYQVTVYDKHNCTKGISVVITQPDSIELAATVAGETGQDNGSVAITHISGGEAPYSVMWSNGDSSTTISELSSGAYSVTITDRNGCHKATTFNVGRATGVENVNGEVLFNAYPNPASSVINLSVSGLEGEATLSLKNALGQTMMSNTVNNNLNTNLNLSSLASGIYFIELQQGDMSRVKKIIVSR